MKALQEQDTKPSRPRSKRAWHAPVLAELAMRDTRATVVGTGSDTFTAPNQGS